MCSDPEGLLTDDIKVPFFGSHPHMHKQNFPLYRKADRTVRVVYNLDDCGVEIVNVDVVKTFWEDVYGLIPDFDGFGIRAQTKVASAITSRADHCPVGSVGRAGGGPASGQNVKYKLYEVEWIGMFWVPLPGGGAINLPAEDPDLPDCPPPGRRRAGRHFYRGSIPADQLRHWYTGGHYCIRTLGCGTRVYMNYTCCGDCVGDEEDAGMEE